MCPIETKTIIERIDSTITVEVPGDTVTVTDSLYCDSLGNVRMIRIHELENENMSIRTRIMNNVLVTDCISDTIYVDKIVKGLNTTTTTEKKINVPYKPWWMIALSWIGGIFLLVVLALLGLKFLKK